MIVDVGAYTGLSALYFSMRYSGARIIAIEANESNFELLVRNTSGFTNIEPVHAALWSHGGSLVVSDSEDGAWGSRVSESDLPVAASSGGSGSSQRQAPAITVADVIREYNLDRIDLLKVDIEGAEKEVFADPVAWIDRVDAICLELHDRFRPGCSRSFFKAVQDFPVEVWRGENVLVARQPSPMETSEG